jgi:hypothetical protein
MASGAALDVGVDRDRLGVVEVAGEEPLQDLRARAFAHQR